MKQRCTACTKSFIVTDEQIALIEKLSPIIGGKTLSIPSPTHCPDCRLQRRLAFRNDNHYYKNTCSSCKKNVISIYSADKGFPVLCHDCFWSDQWDPYRFGGDIDFSKTFAEQYAVIRKATPRLCIFNTQSENSDYTVHSSRNKNCYMCGSTVASEDLLFCDWAIDCKDCSDLVLSSNLELCYACNDSRHCFGSDYLDLCDNVSESYMCFDCHASQLLVGCVSLKNKKYMILNEPAEKKTVEDTIRRLKTDSAFRKEFKKKYDALNLALPKRAAWNINAYESSGNYLQNTKGAFHCFNCMDVEDCMFAYDAIKAQNCCDITRGSDCDMLYECKGIIDLKLSAFCNLTYQCDNLLYCDNCNACSYCFGCFSLKKAKYCIFNKQYTKEEYETLVPKIVEHMRSTCEWGEFFHPTLSSFGYNETKAADAYPLSKEDIQKRGWLWSETDQSLSPDLKAIEAERLPENINDVPDDILNYVIASEGSRKPFRIIPQELLFYRKRGLPLPHHHPHERLRTLAANENPRTLWKRICDKCHKGIETTYAPERPETVFCESCYLKEVY